MKVAKRRRKALDPPAINQIAWSTLDNQVQYVNFLMLLRTTLLAAYIIIIIRHTDCLEKGCIGAACSRAML